jgi:hypothetical protein
MKNLNNNNKKIRIIIHNHHQFALNNLNKIIENYNI